MYQQLHRMQYIGSNYTKNQKNSETKQKLILSV